MFNPLKMAGDLKNIEKMLKPALEKFMNESGFVKQEEIEEIKARLDKIESMIIDLKNLSFPSFFISSLILVALISEIDLSNSSSSIA